MIVISPAIAEQFQRWTPRTGWFPAVELVPSPVIQEG